MQLLPTPLEEEALPPQRNRCSCFDAECAEVTDHMRCYLGKPRGSKVIGLGLADGYCPHLLGMATPFNVRST
jgi:hypothetical protein